MRITGLAARAVVAVVAALGLMAQAVAQTAGPFEPVTDAMIQHPDPKDWLSWRRTLDSWAYSPLDEIDRSNVGQLRLVWSRPLPDGHQEGTPLVHNGVLYFPGPGANYGFRNGYRSFDPSGHDGGPGPGTPAGDLSPYRPGDPTTTDGVRGDFEEQFLTLNRISNLITTRSDSFTCYIYVAGVQYAGTPDARIKVQRRVGLIIDRSTVTPDRPTAHVQRFSQE